MDCNTLPVFGVFGPLETFGGFWIFPHSLVATGHGIPHPGVFGTGYNSSTEIVQSIVIHVLELVGLTEAVPGSEIFGVDLHSMSVGVYGPCYVLHLQVFVAHQGPCCQTGSIEF